MYKQEITMTSLNEYITRIQSNDTTLTEIDLTGARLNDADIEKLMCALDKAPAVAERIKELYLRNNNRLTRINIAATLTALQYLRLGNNQLTSINIPATLTALQQLRLGNNQLTSINIPATLTALQQLMIDNNRLTSINIPATLTALQVLYLNNNQLTSINIPATLTALQQLMIDNNELTSINIAATLTALQYLRLGNNQLTSINIPAKLTALMRLFLEDNQLTSIDIPVTLTALRELNIAMNQLTSINIPAKLTALQQLYLNNNQLTMAIKIALRVLMVTSANLTIQGIDDDNNIAAQLTPEIIQAHFEAMKPVFLANMESRKFKNEIINLSPYSKLPLVLIIEELNFNGVGPIAELNKNIAMFKDIFVNDEQLTILNNWLNINKHSYMADIYAAQNVAAVSILNKFGML
jgi:Leucine-rich repeat (LRR) protein